MTITVSAFGLDSSGDCPGFSGKVLKVNDPLGDSPEYVNEDCYDEGWMIQVEMRDPKELEALMSAEQYQAYLKDQESH